MYVVEVHQRIQFGTIARYRARLTAPCERQVRPVPFAISCPESRNLSSLPVQIAAQLPGNIQHPRASAVIALIQHVVRSPEIVRTALRRFILRDFLRMLQIRHVHYMTNRAYRNPVAIFNAENRWENFISYEKIILVPEHAVRPRQPPIAIKFVMVE